MSILPADSENGFKSVFSKHTTLLRTSPGSVFCYCLFAALKVSALEAPKDIGINPHVIIIKNKMSMKF